MSALATAPGVITTASRLYVTADDVKAILGCMDNKAYEVIREVNTYAKKKGFYSMPQGKANKYLFAEMYGFPQEEIDRLIGIKEEV